MEEKWTLKLRKTFSVPDTKAEEGSCLRSVRTQDCGVTLASALPREPSLSRLKRTNTNPVRRPRESLLCLLCTTRDPKRRGDRPLPGLLGLEVCAFVLIWDRKGGDYKEGPLFSKRIPDQQPTLGSLGIRSAHFGGRAIPNPPKGLFLYFLRMGRRSHFRGRIQYWRP